MLKSLYKDDTQTTPFVATQNWEVSNVINEDLILMEHSGSAGLPVALEYIDNELSGPITASACNIALEQQELDLALFKDGLKVTGIFYPNSDPQNPDGTYQRCVYTQIAGMFYNNYRDPTKIWGLENIDFENSKTKRFITDKFKMFEIPQAVFGEKMLPNTIVMYDTTTDNNYTIVDDGNGNLFAGTNLFSRQQELGTYPNNFVTASDRGCDWYWESLTPKPSLSFIFVPQDCIGAYGFRCIIDVNGTLYGTDGSNFFSSPDGYYWTFIGDVNDTIVSFIYVNSLFVGVGNDGVIYTSSDAIVWYQQVSPTLSNLQSIIYANGQYVAVGTGGTTILSLNGTLWTKHDSPVGNDLYSVIYAQGQYVAVGRGGIVITSTNATLWSVQISGVSSELHQVIYDGNNFVAAGFGGTIIVSSNGTLWNIRSSDITNDLYTVLFDNGVYYVAGLNNTFYQSTDTIVWTPVVHEHFSPEVRGLLAYGSSIIIGRQYTTD
jgi:hypothetical protein